MSSNVGDPKVATHQFMTGLMDPPHRYAQRWTSSEEQEAVRAYKAGIPIEIIAGRLGRSIYATRLRIYRATGRWKTPNSQSRPDAALRD